MKKKILVILLALSAVIACIFGFVACGGNNSGNSDNDGSQNEPDEAPGDTEHHYGGWKIKEEPTCTEDGSKYRTCTDENCDEVENRTIPALGHDPQSHEAKQATCTEVGWEAYDTCSRCTYTTYEEIGPLDHYYIDGFCKWCSEPEPTLDNLIFTLKDDGTYSVKAKDLSITKAVIPSSYDGKPVTSIEGSAFYGCTELSTIVIPDSVISIGESAFQNTAYYNNQNNWINYVIYIGKHLIKSRTSLVNSYQVKEGTLTIADTAFKDASPSTVIIPNSVKTIGKEAFSGCKSLTDIIMNADAALFSIGNSAFRNCTKLENITIPDGVISIESGAFYNCNALASVTIPNGVTIITNGVFYNCLSLKEITIPDNVTTIEGSAFYWCSKLASVTLGRGVASINISAFNKCDVIADFAVHPDNANYKSIDGSLYSKDGETIVRYAIGKKDSSFTIPNDVISIGEYAFYGCKLTSVTIGSNVTSIGNWAFYYSTSLTSITIPDNVTSIGSYSFSSCSRLTSAVIGDGVREINVNAFEECTRLKDLTIGTGVTRIGSAAFYNCEALVSVNVPYGVTIIENSAFYSCDLLESINIPSSVTSIGAMAFQYCGWLRSIFIPKSVTSIGIYAFGNCSALTIYCEVESKPGGWNTNWNNSKCPVVWGYQQTT